MNNYKLPSQILNDVVQMGFLSTANESKQIDLELRIHNYSEEIVNDIITNAIGLSDCAGFEPGEVSLKKSFISILLMRLCEVRNANSPSTTKKEVADAMKETFIRMRRVMEIIGAQRNEKVSVEIKLAEGHVEPKKLSVPRRKTTKLKEIQAFISDIDRNKVSRREVINMISEKYGVSLGTAAVYVSRFS